ncbi:hypothetical protein ACFLYU_02980 [Candidatus Dependentiae bacterium]
MTKKAIKAILEKMKDKILRKTKHWFQNWFLRFLQIQLVISLALLVILPSWGLPLSILSPIGNMLFTPVFTVFLMLSSIIFFLELLFIPNSFFIYGLEKLSHIWLFLTPDLHNQFLIGFTKPPLAFLLLVPATTLAILSYKKIDSIKKSILALALLFALSCAYLKIINAPKNFIKNIPCNGGDIVFIYDDYKNHCKSVLIDPGFMGRRLSAPSFVQYTLMPEIIKTSGRTHIDRLIILQPGKITFDAITQLCKLITIKHIDLVVFDGKMKYSTLRSFFALKDEAIKRNITISRIGRQKSSINLTKEKNIAILPLKQKIAYNKLKYPAICLEYSKIDKNTLKIYSAKCNLNK